MRSKENKPSAAQNLEEVLEETLALGKFGVLESLRKSLGSTNIIESFPLPYKEVYPVGKPLVKGGNA
ncbi:MAG: hypothetical protein DRP11_04990 [Candidatus Aenigmatarchaeota archaeon]|nr:MAG: hypothetical protein DRP11_04990 [Candidatus Aenigmarchaeota archaeon]